MVRETTWRRFREAERERAEDRKLAADQRRRMIADTLDVADSLEDALRVFEQAGWSFRKKGSQEHGYLKSVHETAIHALEKWGVHSVPLQGKRYAEVEFRGASIPHPWTVVAVKEGKAGGGSGRS